MISISCNLKILYTADDPRLTAISFSFVYINEVEHIMCLYDFETDITLLINFFKGEDVPMISRISYGVNVI